ncbi:YebC/PmpR family DNA-binding transcriptional regulator [Blattabacterium cuenoti]|uniref:YebC/PmpR family DNA-binding transcriptional regulator n=1 Tax=Blattabacterium cuenoti TaxID=1653831 RepID=UPI00163CC4C3|nr:YebC/PmpR family DNA-binding transcriptional regulator [Blattabacterium cuenoti]
MSGHSKWANIQHRKCNQDFRKSKKFSKIIKEISVAVKESGSDKTSFRLRKALLNAKSVNIPKNTIERAMQKASQANTNNFKNLNLEGKICGISMIIECMTDNNIRTTSDIRVFFHKKGGRLCHNGELVHLFNRIGVFSIRKKNVPNSMEDFELMAIDFGAKDLIKDEKTVHIYTDFEYFGSMKNHLERLNISHQSIVKRIAKHPKYISKKEKERILSFMEEIEKHEDVKNIYSDYDPYNQKNQ